MDFLKTAKNIAYKYMEDNPKNALVFRPFYSHGVIRREDYRYRADMNEIFPKSKNGDRARLRCDYVAEEDCAIGMSISLLGPTELFVNGERVFKSDVFAERNNHIPNVFDIKMKKGTNELELRFKKTPLGFGAVFGTHLAKWDYVFVNPNDHNREGCVYCLNDNEFIPETYACEAFEADGEAAARLLDPKNVELRSLPAPYMYLRPYYGKGNFGRWNYPLGVVMYGLMRTAEITDDENVKAYAKQHICRTLDTFDYAMWDKCFHGGATSVHNLLSSIDSLDDCGAFGAAVEEAMLLYGVDGECVTQFVADYIENRQARNADGSFKRAHQLHSFHDETMWLDDMYMSVPFLVRRYKLTGNEKYIDDAANQFVQYKKRLYDEDKRLMSHVYDLRHKTANGVAWGRGNGWFVFSLTELLGAMSREHPQRKFTEELFKTLAKGYLAHQSKSGRWHQVIDDGDSYLETSCSAMFACAFMRGFKAGLLGEEYKNAAIKAVEDIVENCVDENGNVYGVCRGSEFSFSADYYKYDLLPRDNDTHGIGIVLLAICEIVTERTDLDDFERNNEN